MIKTSWRRGVVALAVSAALSGAVTSVQAAGESSSGIVGSVDAGAGYSVSIKNADTGLSRELTTDASGSFRFSQLPVGSYEIIVSKNGAVVGKQVVKVTLAGNATAKFELAGQGAEVIEVVGARPSAVDLTSTDSGLVVGEADFDKLPVARNLTAVALLAPGTVPGESRFGNLASFGGASVAENSCYINGLEVTDTRQGLGCGSVPFEFYKEFQVKTGGYSPQFGRTTGGLINAVTKSGGNEWEFAFTANYIPGSLGESGSVSRATGGTGVPTGPNSGLRGVFRDFSHDETDLKEFSMSASGPIIQDKLFIYALYNPRYLDQQFSTVSGNAARTATNRMNYDSVDGVDNAFWGTKIDWDISDNHRLSAFAYSDRRDTERDVFVYNANTGVQAATPSQLILERGGEAQSVTYTGHFTDDLTVSAMVGQIETQFFNEPSNTTCPTVTDSRGVSPGAPSCFVGNDGSNFDKNTQQRLDVEWALGEHLVRAGLDYQNRASENTTIPSGGATYTYTRQAPLSSIQIIGNPWTNTTGADLDVVAMRVFSGGGAFESDMKAYYLEDQWQVTDDLMLTFGVRHDALTNYGTTGIAFADFAETAPRLGASWDPTGAGTSKIYATAGRYFLPISNNTNFRMASGVSDSTTFYRFAGPVATFDPVTGAPTGITPINGSVGNSTNTNSLPVFPDMTTTQAQEAKPFYKDELIVGYETEVSEDYKASVRAVYREVASGLDDYCGDLAPACVLLNPGQSGTWGTDDDGDGTADAGTIVTHSAAEIGLPEAENVYKALQFQLDHSSADLRWSFLYTWSKSYGNFEGAVKSDIAQADAGITQDFDFPALTDGAEGYQANDRRHVLKFYGAYSLTDQLSVGWNSVLASGRPLSTFGAGYPSHDPHIYGSYGDTFYLYTGVCPDTNGTAGCQQDEKQYVYAPRGSAGRTPWTFNLDVSMDYDFSFSGVDMRASLDVFNILNSQEITASNEHYESSEGVRNQYYGSAYTYQAPLSVRLGFEARF